MERTVTGMPSTVDIRRVYKKAQRYDAIIWAVRMTVQSLKADIGTLPNADEVGNNIIKACEYGRKITSQQILERMEGWLDGEDGDGDD